MLQLVNLSNYISDNEMIQHDAKVLESFIKDNALDGVEMMFCAPWDTKLHPKCYIHGVHLRFWPSWLDFWRQDWSELLTQFGSREAVQAVYGGLTPEDWLQVYRANIAQAAAAGAKYVVFHVSQARTSEVYDWRFSAGDEAVIAATLEVVNALAPSIPPGMTLLFENLWWPGLTLRRPALVERLLSGVKHANCGLMLDTGHLMNTEPSLQSETESVAFVLKVLQELGSYREAIRGIHLHQSQSGAYVRRMRAQTTPHSYELGAVMQHVLTIDEHRPFTQPAVRQVLEAVAPQYVVHEFMYTSLEDWAAKLRQQQLAAGLRRGVHEA